MGAGGTTQLRTGRAWIWTARQLESRFSPSSAGITPL